MKTKRILALALAFMTVLSVLCASVSVTAEEASPYKDVKTTRWSYADIMYVTEKGLMNGTEPDKFAPGETMTRAMVVTVLHRLQGAPEMDYKDTFKDVKAGKWYTDAILWAAEKEIVNGVGDGKFDPMGTITREQLATIIMRYAPKEYIITEERADITGYADYKKVRDYAKDALSWANAIGLITGKTADTLAPREGATREQFAKILRCFKEYDSYKYELVYNAPTYNEYVKPTYDLVTDADIYVSTTGNDNNDGSFAKPVKTFERARDMVRAMDKTGRNGITVAFMAGDYGYLNNLTFTAEDSGTAECPIIYTAYGDGDVIFRNGLCIPESDFVPISTEEEILFSEGHRSNIMKVDLNGKIDEITNKNILFSSTGICHEARYPNKNEDGTDNFFKDFTTRVEEEGKKEGEYDKLLLQGLVFKVIEGFSTVDGLKVTGFLRTGWFIDTFPVKSYDKATKHLQFDFSDPSVFTIYDINEYPLAYEDRMDDTVFFSNLPEMMDNEGEYWFDVENKLLYVYSPDGDYAIGTGGTFMTLADDVSNIKFSGLEFNTTTEIAIESNGDNITYDRCTFGNIGGSEAIYAWSVKGFLAENCEFYNFVNQAIRLDGDPDMAMLTTDNNAIRNCYFHDFGLVQYFSNAIHITYCVDAVIEHNLFRNASHGAINFGDTVGLLIQYNVFDNMMMTTSDYGAVYTYQEVTHRDNAVRYNLFTNIRAAAGQYSIYLDGSYGVEVYGNLFYNGGDHNVVFNGGRDNDVHDNITISNRHLGDFLMYNPGPYSVAIGDGGEEDTEQLIVNLGDKPEEGERGYDVWKSRWPILYEYNMDMASAGEFNSFYSTINYVKNNKFIGSRDDFGKYYDLFGVKENNEKFEITENPYFADPTHGDYTVVKGEEQFGTIYEFDKFGYKG